MKTYQVFFILIAVVFISACCAMNVQKCCQDGKQNQDEEFVDCGGPCDPCISPCEDGLLNGDEVNVDCGGSCPPCMPTCEDGIRNGDEIGIDCGGSNCAPEREGKPCHCFNGQQDSILGETGIDEGGVCSCDIGKCTNGQLDECEQQIDCGGACVDCVVRVPNIEKELMITDLAIIESQEAKTGDFSFGHMIRNMAPSEGNLDLKALVLSLLASWDETQTVNGFNVSARSNIRSRIINPWKSADGQAGVSDANWNMNLDNAPFRLMAIVNRVDLHKISSDGVTLDRTGEGRFVYCAFDPSNGLPLQYTLIFEYNLPGNTPEDLITWTKRWHHLGTFASFNSDYIDALKEVTNDFAGRGMMTSGVNGNAIAQIRTNEVLNAPWELREFNLDSVTGFLAEVTRKQTPDISLNNSTLLADFINENGTAIDEGTFTIPERFQGNSFMAGNVPISPSSFEWSAPGISTGRMKSISLETCNGCHGGTASTAPVNPLSQMNPDTFTSFSAFTHIKPRFENQRTVLSEFLAADNADKNDLENRVEVMQQLMDELPQTTDAASVLAFIKSRGNRTH